MSTHLWLMKGQNDSNLKFPFKGLVTIHLLNQLEDSHHYPGTLWSPEHVINEGISGRVTDGERAKDGWGYGKFIKYEALDFNDEWKCQYLKDDCVFIRINSIERTY
jgi:TNF receptor-associated factor 4